MMRLNFKFVNLTRISLSKLLYVKKKQTHILKLLIFILGIICKVVYDQTLDQLVGIVLPFDQHTGIPIRYEFTARDEEEIRHFMKHDKSTLVYIVMAIPMKQGIAPFILQMFGTNNKFKTIDVIRRWNFTIHQLNG